MGDSSGTHPGFTALGPDIGAAISALRSAVPSLDHVILCGLCDGASAIALRLRNAAADGAILLNPWARSDKTLAAAQVRAHYPRQMLSPDLWRKLITGRINPLAKAREFLALVARSRQSDNGDTLADDLHRALLSSNRPVLLVLAGQDMTATEFEGAVLRRLQSSGSEQIQVVRIGGADHTFSRAVCWQSVGDCIEEWLIERQRGRTNHRKARRCR
jgi:exosortase A-associated hydrolase 1